jgi:exopolysaccharide biosynthesis polyprenyl glycosylphosphotransferase
VGTVRRRILLNLFKLFDLVLMVCAFVLATVPVLREHGGHSFTQFLSMRVKVANLGLFLSLLIIWHIIFSVFGLYQSKRLASRSSELMDVLKATTTATIILGTMAVLFRIELVNSTFLLVFWALVTGPGVLSRLMLRYFLGRLRTHHRNLRCMLIVGTNRRTVEFARKIEAKPELGYRIVGFVDADWDGVEEFRQSGYPIVGSFDDLPGLLRQSVVDEVVMGLPVKSHYFQAARIAAMCEEQGIMVRFPSSIFDLKLARTKAEDFAGDSVITMSSTGSLEDWPAVAKRTMDLVLSFLLLTGLSPLLLMTALMIKLTSPGGPVFFRQKRLGLNKRIFQIFKFRTMVPDAEQKLASLEKMNEVSGPVFKIKNDPRITPIGRFLRKTSIDELPQLINVLTGEMSLVGPRPLPVRDYEGFDKDWQRRRFSVRPGITCLWQINGRSSIPFEQWMELDMQYIDKWSLWLDVKILYRTIPAVLKGSGAA